MIKVLLVYEDYNELVLAESFLKKVGFDVVGISNEILVHDQLLSFNPDIVVANGKSQRVSSFSIGQKMKENQRFHGKCIIVVPKDTRPAPQEILKMKMDGILEAPVQPEKLIQVLCRLANTDSANFIDKFQKAKISDPELQTSMMVSSAPGGESTYVTGKSQKNTQNPIPLRPNASSSKPFQDPERIQNYSKFTENVEIDMKRSTHDRKDLKDRQKDLKKDWNFDKLDDLDEQRIQFANALFKKK